MMKVKGLNGREYTWNLTKYDVKADDKRRKSKYHLRARALLKDIYHSYRILEEVKLPGSTALHKKGVLNVDFFIPNLMKAIEVHVQQHYEFCPFFHKSKADFMLSKARDEDKIEWCELNDIEVVELKYSDTDEVWREQIVRI